jgi:excisionase family DNA binding protein
VKEKTPMKILTVKETAVALKVKPQWVYRMMSNDGLPCIRLGRQIRVDEDSLKKWLTAHSCVK